MAKIKCKGTKLQQDLASVYTDVAQVISFEHSGCESETFDATSLDSGVFKEYAQTGYSEPGTVSGELFYDPALAGHQNLTDLIVTPADENWKVIFADSGASVMGPFVGAGFAFGFAVDMGDGLKGSFSIQVDGNPGHTT